MSEPVHFIGLLRSPVSWAKVGRELVRALVCEGAYVSAVSLKGHLYDEGFPIPVEVQEAIGRKRRKGWDVALDYPPNFARLNGDRKAGIVIYEADRLPAHWVDAMNGYVNLAIVSSRFCLEAATASGVPRGLLRLVPFGVDADVCRPDGPAASPPTGRSFNFLTVGAPHVRKGLREVTEAFCQGFSVRDDVGLVIKCPPIPQLGRRSWEYKSTEDFLPEGRGRQITLLQGSISEDEMASLYRACDVYVQASYGEAFGLAAVEAAGCGKPVITANWAAAAEILSRDSAYLVDYDLIDATRIAYDWQRGGSGPAGQGPPHMAKPRVESLAAAMRSAYEDAALREGKGKAALEVARGLTWKAAAKALIRALED